MATRLGPQATSLTMLSHTDRKRRPSQLQPHGDKGILAQIVKATKGGQHEMWQGALRPPPPVGLYTIQSVMAVIPFLMYLITAL